MEKITVKLNVAGEDYKLVTEDSAAYLTDLAREVDLKIAEYQKNPHISTTQAAVLTALEYADKAKKDGSATDNLRAQLKTYLEDAAQAKSERDFYKREVERIIALRMDHPEDLAGNKIPPVTQYALRIRAEEPIVVQFGRLDTTQNNMAYYVGVGYCE